MELVDTHCHLYLPEFESDRAEMIRRAEEAGVSRCYLPSVDSQVFNSLLELESQFSGRCFAMAGIHPCSVKANYKDELIYFRDAFAKRRFVAVGEIGLDFYWDRSFEKEQFAVFHEQIDWALHYKIPIVIHSRDSMNAAIQVVRERQRGDLRGIFHCFGDDLETAREIIDLGFFLGVGGIVTFKNSKLPEVLKQIDLSHLVLETDAPYLAPVPFRGKRNESSYLTHIARRLAEIKELPLEDVGRITSENALNIFGG